MHDLGSAHKVTVDILLAVEDKTELEQVLNVSAHALISALETYKSSYCNQSPDRISNGVLLLRSSRRKRYITPMVDSK